MKSTVAQRFVVLGAGWLGAPLADALAHDGHHVWAVRRSAEGPALERASLLRGDVRDAAGGWRQELPDRIDGVILTVAPARRLGEGRQDTYVRAARAAAGLARDMGASTLLYTSSTGVYGGVNGALVDESAPLDPSEAGAPLIDAERAVLDWAARSPSARAIVLRVAGLYGPERDPYARLRSPTADRWSNYVWRDDVIDAVRTLLSSAPTGATVFNCADGAPFRSVEMAHALGAPVASVANGPPSEHARSNQRVSTDRLRALGWRPEVVSMRDGLRRLGHALPDDVTAQEGAR